MKKIIYLLAFLTWATLTKAQNVNLEVQIVQVERTGYGDCGLCGNPDPAWTMNAVDNGAGGSLSLTGWCYSYGEMGGTIWNPGSFDQLLYHTGTNATTVTLKLDAWENDCQDADCSYSTGGLACAFGAVADNNRCTNNSLSTINFRNQPPCQWNTYTTPFCGRYRYQVRIWWSFASAPTVTATAPYDRTFCTGTNTTLAVTVANDANGNAMGKFFKWQVNTATSDPASCATSGWTDVSPAATSSTYTPPQTPGTRIYRCLVTSNCAADFNSNTTASQCFRVTYAPISTPPAIQSAACGATVLPGVGYDFDILRAPAAGAVINSTSYTWAATGGATISPTNAAPTVITFPSSGSYTVSVTYGDACPAADAVSTCNVIVSQPACGAVYVATSADGGNDANQGGPDGPVLTLTRAMALYAADNSRNTIRIAGGTYTETNIINLADNLVIDGCWEKTGTNWKKNSSKTVTINMSGSETVTNGGGAGVDVCHTVGFKAVSKTGWTLNDLKIVMGNSSGSASSRGCSNYGVFISGCSNYNVTRCDITTGNASAGANGTTPAGTGGGANGGSSANGGGSANGCGNPGGGGTGAAGATGTGGPGYVNPAGSNGAGGGGGGGGGDPAGSGGICCGGVNGNAGATGGAGLTGSSWNVNDRPTATITAIQYFLPAGQSVAGQGGGGGGQGGGGSGARFGTCVCGSESGGNGGAGGAGGKGGLGGNGGFGGGGTFGIWAYNSATGSNLQNITYTLGSVGTGGNGAAGQAGASGSGGAGGGCDGSVVCGQCAGNGGTGGAGGTGGRGRDGANGLSAQLVVGTTTSSPSVTIPSPATVTVDYSNGNGATNSQIGLTKSGGGNWTLPAGFAFVNDQNTSSTSYTVSSSSINVYATATGTYDVVLTPGGVSNTLNNYIKVISTRQTPSININPNPICPGTNFTLTATIPSGQSAVDYDWVIFNPASTVAASTITSSSLASVTLNASAPNFTPGSTYRVRLMVRDPCMGWSIPVYSDFTVSSNLTAPVINGKEDVCYNGDPGPMNTATAPTGGNGTWSYQWYQSDNCSGVWTAIPSTNASSYDPPSGLIVDRCFQMMASNACGSVYSNVVTKSLIALPSGGVINGPTVVCAGDANVGYSADGVIIVNAYTWNITGAASSVTSGNSAIVTFGNTSPVTLTCTPSNQGCPGNPLTLNVTVNPRPTGALSGSGSLCNGGSKNLSIAVTGTGPWNGTLSDGTAFSGNSSPITVSVSPTSNATYTLATLSDSKCTAKPTDLTGTVNITVSDPATADAGPDITGGCSGLATSVSAASVTNDVSYNWTHNGTGTLTNATTLTPTYVSGPGETLVTLTLHVTAASPCPVVTDDMDMTFGTCNSVWLGYSVDWFDPNNWSYNAVPNSCAADVTIPTAPVGGNFPHITTTSPQVGDINVQNNAIIDIDAGQKLSVCATFVGGSSQPSHINGAGELELNGSTNQAMSGKTEFQTLRLNNATGATLAAGSRFDIFNEVALQSGTITTGSGTLIFRSTSDTQIGIIDNFSAGYTGSISGNIKAERYYHSSSTYDAHYMGSPINNLPLSQFGAGGTGGYAIPTPACDETGLDSHSPYGAVASLDETNGATCGMASWKFETGGSAVNGKGYSVRKYGAGVLTVTGAPNLGSSYTLSGLTNTNWTNITLQGRPMGSGWAMIGNPYLANLDISNTPSGFYSQKLVWHNAGPFAGSYQAATIVPPFQAFLAHVTTPGTPISYTINGSDRTKSTAPAFMKQANDQQLKITAENTTTQLLDVTTVAFNGAATTAFDPEYDGQKFAGALNRHTLYTYNSDPMAWMSDNILHSIDETSTVPMGFEPGISGSYVFHFDGMGTFDPTSYVKLEDKKLGLMHDVRNGDYAFTSDSADNWNRFVLHFTPAAKFNMNDGTCNANGQISLQQPGSATWNYTMLNQNGVLISSGTLSNNAPVSVSAAPGVYTLTLTDINGYTVVKNLQLSGLQTVQPAFNTSKTVAEVGENIGFSNTTPGIVTTQWDMGDGTLLNGQAISHQYAQEGVYSVTMMVENADACQGSTSQSITVTAKATTGINELAKDKIAIWSNEDRVYVDFSSQKNVEATISIYNLLGQVISTEQFGKSTIYTRTLNNLEAGYVVVSVKNNEGVTTKQVFITNTK